MKKRIFQAFLVLFGLLVLLCCGVVQLLRDSSSYGTVDEKGVFHIYTIEDLRWFLYYADIDVNDLDAVLEADLYLEAEPLEAANAYSAHFDGQGHAVIGLKEYLFRLIKKDALIENLELRDVDIRHSDGSAGGIACRSYGLIRGCLVSGRVEASDYAGGIVSGNFGVLSDCTNYADIISTQTGEDYRRKYYYDGYGAGGIAGLCGTSGSDKEVYLPETTAILNCANYGSVTAQTLAGGICAYVNDRTGGGAANLSVQEFVKTKDFAVYYDPEDSGSNDSGSNGGRSNGGAPSHFSLICCKNYGTVTVRQIVDSRGRCALAAGICGDLKYGDLYHCANLGRVMISEEAPKVSDTGWVYGCKPYAVTDIMGLSPSINHIVDCVSLKGVMPYSMRRESIMEVTEEELKLWDQGQLPYISNSWRFQLEEAVRLCSLEPLGVAQEPSTKGKENVYRCPEFILTLPEGFSIEEESVGGVCYALHIKRMAGEAEQLPKALRGETSGDFEVWLLRKEADVEKAMTEAAGIQNKMEDMDHKYLMEEIYDTIPNYFYLGIETLKLPFHDCVTERNCSGKRIFMEYGLPFRRLGAYQQEGDHVLGNYISMPLEGNREEGLRARWILVFTNSETNIHPTRCYVDAIEQGFYPLDGKEKLIEIRRGDTLTALARQYTGEGENWRLLADLNGLENPDLILPGGSLLVPDRTAYERKQGEIGKRLF